MTSVFSNYASTARSKIPNVSTEADVNINIDVNEGVKSSTPEVPAPVSTPPAPASYSNPFEGQTVNEEPQDITASDGVTEEVTEEVVQPPADTDGAPPTETPDDDSDNPFDTDESAGDEDETAADVPSDEEASDDGEVDEDKEETVEKSVASLESVHYTLSGIKGKGEVFDAGHAALAKLAIGLAVAPLGAPVAAVTPSLESDNYFDQTNINSVLTELESTITAGKATIASLKKK